MIEADVTFKPEYQDWKFTLHHKLLDRINLEALANIEDDRVRAEVRQSVLAILAEQPNLLTAAEKLQISDEVLHEVFGLGPLEPLLHDAGISDILVNGYRQVYVERKGLLELTGVRFKDDGHLLRIIDKIVSQVGRRVDESNPMVDARLLDGSRVNAIIPPLAVDGPLLSIRRFGTDKLMPDDLVRKGALTQGMMQLLEAAVRARLNIIVSGGTGAGKTTLLNALSAFISPKERIVTIEDAAELQLKQPHLARLETRPANLEGSGAVRQRQLLVNSLRMRPDRIIVGEVRGEEALDMLQAMNTGHDGSLTTVHANTPRDAVSRLEVMVTLANANMHLTAIRQQIASAVHILVQCARLSDGSRRVTNITEVTGIETDIVSLQDIFTFEKHGLSKDGRVLGLCGFRDHAQVQRKADFGRHQVAGTPVRRDRGGGQAVSIPIFILAWMAAMLTYGLVSAGLVRRDHALSLRRLSVSKGLLNEDRSRSRLRLIDAVDAASGRLTARLLERLRVKQSMERMLDAASLKWGAAGLQHRSAALFLAAFATVTLLYRNRYPLAALAAATIAGYLPLWWVRRKARVRVRRFEEQFPDCLEFISRSMRAGHGFSMALEMVPREFAEPLAGEFRRTFEEQNLGQPIDIVLRKLSKRIPSMDLHFFVSAVVLQKRTGGNLAELLDKLAQLIRERFKLRARIRAVSAQGLMSGRILASIPLAVCVLMFVVNPQYTRFFLDDPAGHELIAAGAALQIIGYLIIRKIVTIEV